MSFLSCLFKIKRHLIDIFSFYQKDNLKTISFRRYLLDIFSLCRKDDLKKITFSRLLIFCTIWDII